MIVVNHRRKNEAHLLSACKPSHLLVVCFQGVLIRFSFEMMIFDLNISLLPSELYLLQITYLQSGFPMILPHIP